MILTSKAATWNHSVFNTLKSACMRLSALSRKEKQASNPEAHSLKNFVYSRMLWSK